MVSNRHRIGSRHTSRPIDREHGVPLISLPESPFPLPKFRNNRNRVLTRCGQLLLIRKCFEHHENGILVTDDDDYIIRIDVSQTGECRSYLFRAPASDRGEWDVQSRCEWLGSLDRPLQFTRENGRHPSVLQQMNQPPGTRRTGFRKWPVWRFVLQALAVAQQKDDSLGVG